MATYEARQAELSRMFKRDGFIKPSVIVREAASKKSPLHDEFEWDDSKAGVAYRLSQARRLIRVTRIRDEKGVEGQLFHVKSEQIDGPTAKITEREGRYKPIAEVVKSPSEYALALRELMTQRNAMDSTIRELKRAAKGVAKEPTLLQQLEEALRSVKSVLRLMLKEA
jgi:hypothetical protein